ncbi:hypothetical protein NC652_019044 [Populus alba x Populus x berolinensis]|uniref:Uncharacterized protein n=1 Tax=Populus alba x Populus x berolinensis TaxID=444605 RepID=A0AAD6QHH2_9ROSI|nr:hypothetical protein NC652_019044 [Populus alba x Populus x berolinensis]KAJ6990472.1 hypothetical protein NC653_018891 [Populus alba x Populus x berolinensis]
MLSILSIFGSRHAIVHLMRLGRLNVWTMQ